MADYALVVGVEQYETMPRLQGPARDALRFGKWLTTQNVPPANIFLFLNKCESWAGQAAIAYERSLHEALQSGIDQPRPPESRLIETALRELLRNVPAEGGTLWVYWSGHGMTFPKSQQALMCCDRTYGEPTYTYVSDIRNLLRSSHYRHFARHRIIIDACTLQLSLGDLGIRAHQPPLECEVRDDIDQVLLNAVGPNTIAKSFEEGGLFTNILLNLLDRKGNWPDDLRSFFEELENAIILEVGKKKAPALALRSTNLEIDGGGSPDEESAEDLVKLLCGSDPVAGEIAAKKLGQLGPTALPALKAALLECGENRYMSIQPALRFPYAFGLIGESSIDALVDVLKNGHWAAKVEASGCFAELPRFPAANRVAEVLKQSSDDMDSARVAIEALGRLGCWQWSHLISEATLGSDNYAYNKLIRYAFRSFALMLALEREHDFSAACSTRVKHLIDEARRRGGLSDEDMLMEWKGIVRHFTALAAQTTLTWLHSTDVLLRSFAVEVVRARRVPAGVRGLETMALRLSGQELFRCLDTLGEIGSPEACNSVLRLMDSDEFKERTDWKLCCLNALSKMYHQLDDDRYGEVSRLSLPKRLLVQSWYTGVRRTPRIDGIEALLDDSDEEVRRQSAICYGITHPNKAQANLKLRLNHAPTSLDRVYLLAGLLRSGAEKYYEDFYSNLGEAITWQSLREIDYIWRREFIALLHSGQPNGVENARTWAKVMSVDLCQCLDEMSLVL